MQLGLVTEGLERELGHTGEEHRSSARHPPEIVTYRSSPT
jgi:hypothetical protein